MMEREDGEWTREGMEERRPSCFDFFLDECENGETCNYSHAPLFCGTLKGIPISGATKEAVIEELAAFDPVHVAFTGNPAHLNFGKGLGKVGFYSEEHLVNAVKGTLRPAAGRTVCVHVEDHKCRNCGAAMRFSQGGVAYFKSTAITGTKKDPKFIAKQAAGPFECGECNGKKKVESSVRERALKQGEVEW